MMTYSPVMFTAMLTIFVGFLTLAFQRHHLLSALLSLEVIMLGIFFLLVATSGSAGGGMMLLVLLTMMVCEASAGLTILVIMVRSHGSDYVSTFSSIKC